MHFLFSQIFAIIDFFHFYFSICIFLNKIKQSIYSFSASLCTGTQIEISFSIPTTFHKLLFFHYLIKSIYKMVFRPISTPIYSKLILHFSNKSFKAGLEFPSRPTISCAVIIEFNTASSVASPTALKATSITSSGI